MAARVRNCAKDRGIAPTALADAAGIKRSSMTYYWRGDRPYPVEALDQLATTLSTSVNWLVTGQADEPSDDGDDDLTEVQEVDLAYGLGGTFSGDSMVEVETHRFPRAWLSGITATPAKLLFIARGRGDSMEPTLLNGDMVIIDRSQRIVREDDALWAITIGEIASIKRLRIRGDKVHLLSDNASVPNDTVHGDEINVVGRVIFIGRRT